MVDSVQKRKDLAALKHLDHSSAAQFLALYESREGLIVNPAAQACGVLVTRYHSIKSRCHLIGTSTGCCFSRFPALPRRAHRPRHSPTLAVPRSFRLLRLARHSDAGRFGLAGSTAGSEAGLP
jgi:hypothetical protein